MKLTTTEHRAKNFCDDINAAGCGTITVEWKRSRDYGHNPVISTNDGKCTNVSGCGYDKLSTALAAVLRFLFEPGSEESGLIHSTAGAGDYSTIRVLKDLGWEMKKLTSTRTIDIYEINRA